MCWSRIIVCILFEVPLSYFCPTWNVSDLHCHPTLGVLAAHRRVEQGCLVPCTKYCVRRTVAFVSQVAVATCLCIQLLLSDVALCWLSLLLRVREVTCSRLCPKSSYAAWGFSSFFFHTAMKIAEDLELGRVHLPTLTEYMFCREPESVA
jgi:hypothetical protein